MFGVDPNLQFNCQMTANIYLLNPTPRDVLDITWPARYTRRRIIVVTQWSNNLGRAET